MIRFEVRRRVRWSKPLQAVALGALVSIAASGCVGGGASSGGNGITDRDEHGDIPTEATVVIPDGANIQGQINYPTDSDWFRFRGIAGVGYVLQISGFPPDPDVRPDLDLTGDGTRLLVSQILTTNGATQLANTTGTDGGEPYDIDPAGEDSGEGFVFIGDTRIMWVCPTTADYFFRIEHERQLTGIGAYVVRLATSQLMTVEDVETQEQTGTRFVFLATEDGQVYQNDFIWGLLDWNRLEFEESIEAVTYGISFFISDLVFMPMADDPEPVAVHAHYGLPNIYIPEFSEATFIVDHPRFGEFEVQFRRRQPGEVWTEQFAGELPDGREFRMPVSIELEQPKLGDPPNSRRFTAIFRTEETIINGTRGSDGGGDIGDDSSFIRSIVGLDWYLDLHPQPDMDLDPQPITASLPMADTYQIFETHLDATSDNVILKDGSRLPADRQRGLAPFTIHYDASLKLFQVARQAYVNSFNYPYFGSIVNPDYTPYVGDRVRVHAGTPGITGPSIINLGTLPPLMEPPTANLPNVNITVREEPGFRAPIRQLTDDEAELLRDTYYEDGIYVEVTDSITGEQLVRAEGFLEISLFPTLDPCSFPPCSGVVPANATQKGVVTFASGLPAGTSIELYANGKLLGVLNEPVSADALPACGLTGDNRTLATELYPGTYYWHAHDDDGDYSGHVTVQSGGCATVLIGPDDLDG